MRSYGSAQLKRFARPMTDYGDVAESTAGRGLNRFRRMKRNEAMRSWYLAQDPRPSLREVANRWGIALATASKLLSPGYRRGAQHGRAKLTDGEVAKIRARACAGDSAGELASAFGVSPGHIRALISGRRR